jgi:hypothetical protein
LAIFVSAVVVATAVVCAKAAVGSKNAESRNALVNLRRNIILMISPENFN